MKVCTKCHEEKPESDYGKHGDGTRPDCKVCRRETKRKYHAKNRVTINANTRAWRKRNPKKAAASMSRWYARKAERTGCTVSARTAVNQAVKAGLLQQQPCEVCDAKKVEGHHDDYTKPLDVRWLCLKHHCEVHGRVAA